jgi:hypothetical protein
VAGRAPRDHFYRLSGDHGKLALIDDGLLETTFLFSYHLWCPEENEGTQYTFSICPIAFLSISFLLDRFPCLLNL